MILINFNGGGLTVACLKSLEGQSYKDFDILIVDNGSSDDSLEMIRGSLEGDFLKNTVRIIALCKNAGFAGGNLTGFAHSDSEYIALLNNDTEPDREWLGNLVAAMERNPAIGICASRLIIFGTDIVDSAGDGYSRLLRGFKRCEGKKAERCDKQEYVFGACAGAALYRRDMLDDIGFLDEDFFLIHEDTDLNFRAQLTGWKVMYLPTAVVYHKVRSTIGHMSDIAVYYTLRNSEFVRIKNIPFFLFLRCLPEFALGTILEFMYFACKHRKLSTYLRAKMDVIRKLKMLLAKRRKIMDMKKVNNGYLYSIMTSVWDKEFSSMKINKFFHG
ncbi:MAG: glycosyltransferase family 2 protein [Thermodesulfovibrionales bacterium]